MNAEVKKRGLGRGLDALFQDVKREEESFEQRMPWNEAPREKRTDETTVKRADEIVAAAVQAASPRKIQVERLVPGKFQPRKHFDDEAIEQLAESIVQHGILQPLLVRPLPDGTHEIIAGERRWRAAQKARLHEVPVIVRNLNDEQALEIGLIENLQREDLTALEEAEGYQRLIDECGHTQDKLALHVGKSRSHIANTLRLLKLPESVKKHIQNGVLSAGHARALLSSSDPQGLAAAVIKRDLSVRQTEKLAAGTHKAKTAPQKTFARKDVDVLALEERMSGILGLRVTVEGEGSAGRLVIEYKSLDQLEGVLQRLSASPKRA